MAFTLRQVTVEWTGYQAMMQAIKEDGELRAVVASDEYATYTCHGFDLRTGATCQRLSERTVDAGCVHEHVSTQRLCASHEDDLRLGYLYCGDCYRADCNCQLSKLEST